MERNRRHRLNLTILQDKLINSPLEEKDDGDDSWYNDDDIHLANLDPLDWKNQDHYDVMGLTSLRWKATDDHIKKAYRKKVLKHHPDKTASGGGKYSDSFFKCIQKSWDVLGDNNKRRQFDSVDPEFDEELPKVNFKGDFFKVYGKCFESNGRFSNKQPVPDLGTPEDTKETVDNFYKFWYSYESWRSFENLDEEDVDSAQSREEKRWLDRKNKAARQKLKKEDNLRITKLIDQAMKADPRIKGFKDAERQDKENKKLAKAAAAQAIIDEAREKVEAEERAKEAILLEAKALVFSTNQA